MRHNCNLPWLVTVCGRNKLLTQHSKRIWNTITNEFNCNFHVYPFWIEFFFSVFCLLCLIKIAGGKTAHDKTSVSQSIPPVRNWGKRGFIVLHGNQQLYQFGGFQGMPSTPFSPLGASLKWGLGVAENVGNLFGRSVLICPIFSLVRFSCSVCADALQWDYASNGVIDTRCDGKPRPRSFFGTSFWEHRLFAVSRQLLSSPPCNLQKKDCASRGLGGRGWSLQCTLSHSYMNIEYSNSSRVPCKQMCPIYQMSGHVSYFWICWPRTVPTFCRLEVQYGKMHVFYCLRPWAVTVFVCSVAHATIVNLLDGCVLCTVPSSYL